MIIAKTAALLLVSNIFMTFAWYGHLNYKNKPLLMVIFASWGLAFFEYCFQVPANRLGAGVLHSSQLKIMQEVITFAVFAVFAWLYLGQKPTRYDFVAYALIICAVGVTFFQPEQSARDGASAATQSSSRHSDADPAS